MMRILLILSILIPQAACWAPHQRASTTARYITSSRARQSSFLTRATTQLKLSERNASVSDKDETSTLQSFSFPWSPAPLKDSAHDDLDYLHNRRKVSLREDEDTIDATTTEGMGPKASLMTALSVGLAVFASQNMHTIPPDFLQSFGTVLDNPTAALDGVVKTVEAMGPLGIAYFGVAYTVAEILAIPAIPLTASAGYLFGPVQGTAVVLVSASAAAAVSFLIGRTLLREYVEGALEEYPKFAKVDKAIGQEGFKLMVLLRLSPLFPFALSNYLYGASSINFSAFFWGTLLGFAPGTMAYVYTGYLGKALTAEGSEAYPWYVYVGGLVAFSGILKVLADTATRIIDELDDEEEL